MSLNPIVALSEQVQKLINEHGSATILRDHLALFKDQVIILEKKMTLLESENIILKTENSNLKTKSVELEKDITKLRSKIQKYEHLHNGLLDETAKNILNKLFETNREITINSLTKFLNSKESVVQYHIDNLLKNKLITKGPRMLNGPTTYLITKEGRKYVVEILHV